MVDFSKLSRPKAKSLPTDPVEIFKRTPNTGGAPNDLWKGQADALSAWHVSRANRDNLIVLNTGAGKSIVGLMTAQSLVNEGQQNVLFVCSTIDLVLQTANEAERLGLSYTTRTRGEFSNDKFETGKSFCITTYQSLFLSQSPFKKYELGGIIFDDAHVSERIIRDSITVKVRKDKHQALYNSLIERGLCTYLDRPGLDRPRLAVALCPNASITRQFSDAQVLWEVRPIIHPTRDIWPLQTIPI